MKASTLLATSLALALPATALGEEVPFSTIGRGWFGPPGEPQQLVFHEEHELVTTLLAQQLDPDPEEQIDWSTHQVIAVLMGTRSSGGHATTIEALELDADGALTVRYGETTPAGPAASFLSAPFHMILCPRTYGAVRFERSQVPRAEETITGRVELSGDEVRLVADGVEHEVQPAARARELARFPRRDVRVVGLARAEGESSILEVSRILSPERRMVAGVVHVAQGRPVLVEEPGRPLRVSGPAQSVVHEAAGARVECDAFVFTDAAGQPVEASVEAVKGSAVAAASLHTTASLLGADVGSVSAGDEVAVLRTFGVVARVRNADGDEGWVHLARTRVGAPLPAQPSATPGLVSAFGD